MSTLIALSWDGLFDEDVIVPICVALVFIVWIMTAAWKSLERSRMDVRLKEQMLAAGYKADEIERVIQASTSGVKDNEDDD